VRRHLIAFHFAEIAALSFVRVPRIVRRIPGGTTSAMSDDNPMTVRTVNAAAQAKAQQAWTLRVAGMPWGRIAEVVGFADDAGAIRAVRRFSGTLPAVEREASRALWRERIELLWVQARQDVDEQRPGAIRAATALAQRAAQLDALDVPPVSVVVSPTASEFESVVQRLVEAHGVRSAVEADIFNDE
jgi:hypothetical protein